MPCMQRGVKFGLLLTQMSKLEKTIIRTFGQSTDHPAKGVRSLQSLEL